MIVLVIIMYGRYHTCYGCSRVYESLTGKVHNNLDSSFYKEIGLCKNCLGKQLPLIELIHK